MRFLIDTANIDDIKEIYEMGVLGGVTTNPTIIAREGKEFKTAIKDICNNTPDDAMVFAEVLSLKADEMVEEAKDLAKIDKKMVIKIPMCIEGLKAVSKLSKLGIKTTVTIIFSATQALMAARAGATFVASFVGRHDDVGQDGIDYLSDIVDIFNVNGIETKIIAASVRTQVHVLQCARLGIDYATIPASVFKAMSKHPFTDKALEGFLKDWADLQAKLSTK